MEESVGLRSVRKQTNLISKEKRIFPPLQVPITISSGQDIRVQAMCVKRSLHTALYCTVPVDEVLSHGEDGLDAVRIGGKLGLEGLVLLMLRLDIGRILDEKT
jgi:hypothetical protein